MRGAAAQEAAEATAAARRMVEASSLMELVLAHLETTEDLGSAATVSRAWRDAAQDDRAWTLACSAAPLLDQINELSGRSLSCRELLRQRVESVRWRRRDEDVSLLVLGPRQDHEYFKVERRSVS